MNVSKIKKNITNLKKIKEIIEISKFDTLQKIQNAKKVTETYFEIALLSKEILEYSKKKYFMRSKLTSKKIKTQGVTWIFATITSKLMASSYDVQEKMLLKLFDKEQDQLIVVGQPAIDFAARHEIDVAHALVDIEVAIAELPSIISSIQFLEKTSEVKFISNSVYNKQKPITILPMFKLELNYEHKPQVVKTYRFYPSIGETIESLGKIYVERLIKGLLREAKFLYLKEKLIRHESSIKTVDKKIDEKAAEMNKEMRKTETEELIHITQIAKTTGGDDD